MKKNHLLLAAVIVAALTVQTANAKIWRVNNRSNYNSTTSSYGDNLGGTSSYPVFAQINQAVGWAGLNDGDTLYVEGSTSIYADAALSRKIVLRWS